MILLLLVLILACVALWYSVLVVFCDAPRRRRKPSRPTIMTGSASHPSNAPVVPPVTLGWTALDDQQLTRLLKGSAPSP
jgi:hypothetical protein